MNKIQISLDLGYASIGWSVASCIDSIIEKVLGCGSVVFEPDKCLASERRKNRRMRRNIRARRVRIQRLKEFLLQAGVIDATIANCAHLDPNPWRLAAEALVDGRLLTPVQLWAVLLWYAHNRGYDGNRLWSAKLRNSSESTSKDDTEKEKNAKAQMGQYNANSMAEAVRSIVTDGNPNGPALKNYKELNLAFPRDIVMREVEAILLRHENIIPGLTSSVIAQIVADPMRDAAILHEVNGIPKAYLGGYLFGQTKPRFDNRMPTICPISKLKTPTKSNDAFLEFRWASLLSRVHVGSDFNTLRNLTPDEMKVLNTHMQIHGRFTMSDFKKVVRKITNCDVDNLNALLSMPESDKALVRYPGLAALDLKFDLEKDFKTDTETKTILKHLTHALALGKTVTHQELIPLLVTDDGKTPATYGYLAQLPSGRAAYSAKVMRQASLDIFEGKNPWAEGGILYRDATKEDPLPESEIDRATNNHLVRHRVKILLRLLNDIIRDYAENNPARVDKIYLEVARDIKDFSGKKQKVIATELGAIVKSHDDAVKKIAKDLNIDSAAVSANLARKIRIAKDLNYTCPYTGKPFDVSDIRNRIVDLDHILPRSQRQTDAMSALVLTYNVINKEKSNTTALQFIRENEGKTFYTVTSQGQKIELHVKTEKTYLADLDKLKLPTNKKERDVAKKRIRHLKMLSVKEESEMTEGMLTQTSAIMKLAMRAIKGWFQERKCPTPRIINLPGRVTKEVRVQYDLLGMLAQFDKRLLRTYKDFDGKEVTKVIPKGDMRKITHMHHAVDAIAILLAGSLITPENRVWFLMNKRHLNDEEKMFLLANGPFMWDNEGHLHLKKLDASLNHSIRNALGELRTVRYTSNRMGRLSLELTQWRVLEHENGRVKLRQHIDGGYKTDELSETAVYGTKPKNGDGKLKRNNAIYIIPDNYGVALMENPVVLRQCFVWQTLQKLAKANNGKIPRVLRNGDIIQIKSKDGNIKTWMLRSIKDSKGTLLLDISYPYNAEGQKNGVSYWIINQRLSSLLKKKLITIPNYTLTGVPSCPITTLKSLGSRKSKSTAKMDNSSK